ncbi:phage head closure protein [Aquibium sp. LZ166]|uniref:Phage head closure protein n=1 Tax=Aquibium pacificus TaxID=3153579 RepID=A0ABV3SDS3_9HYPH
MRAGKLDRIITIDRVTTTVDEYGTPVEGWSTVTTVRAQRVKLTTDEFLRAFGTTSEAVAVFRIRHMDGLTLADRVTCDGETFDLKAVEPLGRREGLELRCVAQGAGA